MYVVEDRQVKVGRQWQMDEGLLFLVHGRRYVEEDEAYRWLSATVSGE